ncbi:hypothetical protein [Pedobacter gandavensis]|uniref:Uncharacterized protein n=1 Tax=Pedobacter gandavensis TaxID=2679963 RepID=A0ABR6EZ06_9SPHI|nr:hypothetical protein [Pedobacter gandavensis]MBB2150513.1 hypothetical protein [Pedobacter gandavensis]
MIEKEINAVPGKLKTFLNFLLLLFIALQGFGQTSVQTEVYGQYKEVTNPSLYNSIAYTRYLPEGIYEAKHPFFIDPHCKVGTLVYNGRMYQDVSIKYDLILDEVIILYLDLASEVLMRKSQLTEFSIGNYNFINMPIGKNIQAGYYQVIHKGKTRVLCRHKKIYNSDVVQGNSLFHMIEEKSPRYYIENNNEFYPVKNEKSLYKIFPEQKNEIKKFISSNALLIKASPASALPLIAEFINK